MLLKVHTKGIFDYLVLQKCVFEPFEVLKLLRFKPLQKVYLLKQKRLLQSFRLSKTENYKYIDWKAKT